MTSLRSLFDDTQNNAFQRGGVADIKIADSVNIHSRLSGMHRALLLHDALVASLTTLGVEHGEWMTNLREAIDKALQLEVLTPHDLATVDFSMQEPTMQSIIIVYLFDKLACDGTRQRNCFHDLYSRQACDGWTGSRGNF